MQSDIFCRNDSFNPERPVAMPQIAVFLDRDGTLIEERNYLSQPSQVALFPETIDALKKLKEFGFMLVMVTNQSGVGRGYFSAQDLDEVHRHIAHLLMEKNVELDAIYICPHTPNDRCSCRKPEPGLAIKASEELDIDLSRSYMIGDKPADIGLATAIGAVPVLVRTGYGKKFQNDPETVRAAGYVADHLLDAASWIISDFETKSE